MSEDQKNPQEKPFRTFPVLQRLKVEDFNLVKLDHQAPYFGGGTVLPCGTWTLQLGGQVFFHLPGDLVCSTVDFTEEEVAAMLFDAVLDARNCAASIGYDRGRQSMSHDLRALISEGEKGGAS